MSKEIYIDEDGVGTKEPAELGLQFPCDMPMKVIGVNSTDFEKAVWDIIEQHQLGVFVEDIQSKLSREGTYCSISFHFLAETRAQVDALYIDLTANEFVKWVL